MDYDPTNTAPPIPMGGFSHQMMALSIRPKDPSKIADLEPAAAQPTMRLSMRSRVQPHQSIFGGSQHFESPEISALPAIHRRSDELQKVPTALENPEAELEDPLKKKQIRLQDPLSPKQIMKLRLTTHKSSRGGGGMTGRLVKVSSDPENSESGIEDALRKKQRKTVRLILKTRNHNRGHGTESTESVYGDGSPRSATAHGNPEAETVDSLRERQIRNVRHQIIPNESDMEDGGMTGVHRSRSWSTEAACGNRLHPLAYRHQKLDQTGNSGTTDPYRAQSRIVKLKYDPKSKLAQELQMIDNSPSYKRKNGIFKLEDQPKSLLAEQPGTLDKARNSGIKPYQAESRVVVLKYRQKSRLRKFKTPMSHRLAIERGLPMAMKETSAMENKVEQGQDKGKKLSAYRNWNGDGWDRTNIPAPIVSPRSILQENEDVEMRD